LDLEGGNNFVVKRSKSEGVMFLELSRLAEYVEKYADSIKQKKFFIIIDSNVRFERTLSVIDILKKNKIDNYRVYNWSESSTWPMRRN
jgi:biopolymer transport protein ExbD